jgi:dTDP-4-dehydrorhamnose reductase
LKILLIGKTGQLGSSLLQFPGAHVWHAPGREKLDIESVDSCRIAIEKYKPDVVINTAAFHNVPLCESEPERALAVNCIAVKRLARLCNARGIRFVTFSSDYVFAGNVNIPYSENANAAPLQMYGISRLAGEHAALSQAPEYTIVIRTCGLYGMTGANSKGGNFVDNRIRDALDLASFEMGSDQTVTPTSATDLAKAVIKLIEHPNCEAGVYHLVNEGQCTWYEFSCKIVELMNLKIKIIPVDRKGLSGEMRRPLYSVLANTKAKSLGVSLPNWQEALAEYINKKHAV